MKYLIAMESNVVPAGSPSPTGGPKYSKHSAPTTENPV